MIRTRTLARLCSAMMLTTICGVLVAARADETPGNPPTPAPSRYTFSWPLGENALQPRGGTTKGPQVTLDRAPSAPWQALQQAGLAAFERDRRAILAMAGTYRVTFDFLEIAPYPVPGRDDAAGRRPYQSPYQSWGTEKIYVAADDGKSISLVHILDMRIVQQDGSISEPMVTKHWRQDWRYEPTHLVEYQGRDQWRRRKLGATENKLAWSQTVYQVDESPRYASVGRWQHSGSFSTWLSADTWRPLPRREWSVRDDYQVLVGTNRHTVSATGWLQEENNLKAVLNDSRALATDHPYVGREYGVARYERIRDADFTHADRYYERTREFWDRVRDVWADTFAQKGTVTLRGPVDKLGLFQPLFARAEEVEAQGVGAAADEDERIRNTIRGMQIP